MIDAPILTIAIPNFNYDKYLKRSIESALAQQSDDIEILVSDNSSSDTSWDIISKFSDYRLKTWRQDKNIGLYQNWNFLLHHSKGRYFKLLQSDDWLELNFMDKFHEILAKASDKDIVAVLLGYTVLDERSNVSIVSSPSIPVHQNIPNEFIPNANFDAVLKSFQYSMPTLNILNSKRLKSVGGYVPEDAMRSDSIAFSKVLTSSPFGYVVSCNTPVAVTRIHKNNDRMRYSRFEASRDEWIYLSELKIIASVKSVVKLNILLSISKSQALSRLLLDFLYDRNVKKLINGLKWFVEKKILLSSLLSLPVGIFVLLRDKLNR